MLGSFPHEGGSPHKQLIIAEKISGGTPAGTRDAKGHLPRSFGNVRRRGRQRRRGDNSFCQGDMKIGQNQEAEHALDLL